MRTEMAMTSVFLSHGFVGSHITKNNTFNNTFAMLVARASRSTGCLPDQLFARESSVRRSRAFGFVAVFSDVRMMPVACFFFFSPWSSVTRFQLL